MIEELQKLYDRDIERLRKEIEAFTREEHLWQIRGQIINPAGNLALHLVGNLSTYIGKNLGQQLYVRNREAEFSSKNIPKQTLLEQISTVKAIVHSTLQTIKPEDLHQTYPENVLGYEMTTGFFLIHLLAHLSYHLGQINYIRRILE
ncbi:DinB family protein [Rhodocytophaga rosea]|uniref:DinB family protein n=1 Tax=Rhodocytophaga rosea TaxID=2704465 RepID=A0A6C0GKJ1_9BACT|nr:DinB family protein [Rhodocytophaga rosea]QHT68467.1 DinB family protein [Rhodocytophaga rosea]